jgi:RNA-directed DNA polymerase
MSSLKKSNLIFMSSPRILLKNVAKEENHSDEFVDEILSYSDKLEEAGLPVIFSLLHFSMLMGTTSNAILKIIGSRRYYYKKYEIKKRKGGVREISSPYTSLKVIQKWIDENILTKVVIHPSAYGFCTGRSIVDNAKEHLDQDFILNIDLLNFFDTIPEKRIYGIFRSLGYHSNLSVFLAKLCTVELEDEEVSMPTYEIEDFFVDGELSNLAPEAIGSVKRIKTPVLPQGAPTSPRLANIVCRRLDKRLSCYALKNGFRYTRYADDITFSGKGATLAKISIIEKIVKEEQFEINKNKIKLFDQKSNKRIVTGLLVSDNIRIPRKFKKEVERHLFFCRKYGVQGHTNFLAKKHNYSKSFYREWLLGKICFIKMVESDYGRKLLSYFNSIDWGI